METNGFQSLLTRRPDFPGLLTFTLTSTTKQHKLFDSVQMVREIRDAMSRQRTAPNLDLNEFEGIEQKWTNLLEQQEKNKTNKVA